MTSEDKRALEEAMSEHKEAKAIALYANAERIQKN